MAKGRIPKPQNMAFLSGNFKRAKKVEPQALEGVPQPPDWLDEIGTKEWWAITGILNQMGLLSRADSTAIECYCEAYSRYRKAQAVVAKTGPVILSPNKQYPMVGPHHSVLRQALKDVKSFLIEFGLTPAARARMGQEIKPSSGDNPWAGLVG